MARIKINDLPKDMKISGDEMKRVRGGFTWKLAEPYIIQGVNDSTTFKVEDSGGTQEFSK